MLDFLTKIINYCSPENSKESTQPNPKKATFKQEQSNSKNTDADNSFSENKSRQFNKNNFPQKISSSTPIKELPLSVRATNALKSSGFQKLEDILPLQKKDFMEIRNIGHKTAIEICELIMQAKEKIQNKKNTQDEKNKDKPISVLPLTKQTIKKLNQHGVTSIRELTEFSLKNSTEIPHIGIKAYNKIKKVLAKKTDLKSKSQNIFWYSSTPIDFTALNIGTREKSFFNAKNIQCIEEFLVCNKEEIMNTSDVGQKTYEQLKDLQIKLENSLEKAKKKGGKFSSILRKQPEWIKGQKINFLPIPTLHNQENQTLQQFLNAEENQTAQIQYIFLYNETPKKILSKIKSDLEELNKEGSIVKYWQKRLPEILTQTFDTLKERRFNIINWRFGLTDNYSHTLEEVGEKTSLTRERVRQIQQETLNNLDKWAFEITLNMVDNQLKNVDGITKFDNFFATNQDKFWKNFRVNGILKIILEMEQFNTIFKNKYILHRDFNPAEVKNIMEAIKKHLQKTKETQSFDNILSKFSHILTVSLETTLKKLNIPPKKFLRTLLDISDEIGQNPYNNYGLINWPEIYPDTATEWAYTVLKKISRPTHWKEIHRKAEAVSGETFSESTFYNLLGGHEYFTLFESGNAVYGLSEWENRFEKTANQTIAELCYQVLEKDAPLQVREVFERITEQKKCSRTSVEIYLKGDPRTIKKNEKYHLHPRHKEMGHFTDDRGKWGGIKAEEQIRRIEKLLREKETTLSLIKIVRKLSLTYEDGPFHAQNLSQILPEAENIVNIGQNNYGLKSQGYEELTYLQAIEKTALKINKKSFTSKKIYDEVQDIRKMGESTVGAYLNKSDKITKLDNGKFALKEMAEELEGQSSKRKRRRKKKPEDGHVFLPLG